MFKQRISSCNRGNTKFQLVNAKFRVLNMKFGDSKQETSNFIRKITSLKARKQNISKIWNLKCTILTFKYVISSLPCKISSFKNEASKLRVVTAKTQTCKMYE